MTVTARLVAAIWLTVLAVGAGFAYFQIAGEHERLLRDLDQRAVTRAERIKAAIEPLDEFELATQIGALVAEHERPGQAIAIHDRHGERLAVSKDAGLLPSDAAEVAAALATGEERRALLESGGRSAYAYVAPIERNGEPAGAVSVVVDASEVAEADRALWGRTAIRLVIVASVVSLVAAWILRAGVTRPMRRMAEWARALHAGKSVPPPPIGDRALFDPLASELSRFGVSLRRAQAAAEREAALRLHADSSWTEERLKQFVTSQLASPLFVVSNREPVIHVWKGRKIEAHTPASGMVSAVEPVVRACGGVWIAHASGDADREVVDASGRVGVPPDHPDFTLRRVWLSPEEEQGYYYGFSNEGIWPLCHIAHARPLFRPEDWEHYREVNRKFADALLEEMAGAESPLVLIQDYHFALLPALVKKERPDARIALFWHIPWPNSEAFGICPWQDDLLLGMLGSDLVGFHTQYHCN
ncbi:MAG TPA: trehalose-6-phosphate synthase, partial [Planctomycetota bacterium]|nr:trehalose-6-phosphate synthase [Planctomycetota bacterium]